MDIGVISVRYARALLKSATDAKIEADVYKEMQTMAKTYAEVPQLRQTIDNPMLSKDTKQTLLLTAVGEKPCELTKAFRGFSDKLLKGSMPAVDCAVTYSFVPANVPVLGFALGFIGELVGIDIELGKLIADKYGIPLLGQIPLVQSVREGGDEGVPAALEDGPVFDAMKDAAQMILSSEHNL